VAFCDIKEEGSFKDKVRGCLLGVAIGDALGAPFEHLGPGESNQFLDPTGGLIKDFHPYMGYPPGSWTDDTGMTLASCRAFIEMMRTGDTAENCHRRAFYDWVGSAECRKPGKTVKRAAIDGVPDPGAWGNGALMRMSPVAIFYQANKLQEKEATELAFRVAGLTHGHPLATFPAVEFVLALMSIFRGDNEVPEGLSDPGKLFLSPGEEAPRYAAYSEKRHLAIDAVHPSTGLWMWRHVLERCLGLTEGSPWSVIPNFERGILKTVNESFDRDTAGAVAGALLGAYWGESGIPEKWRTGVEKADIITALADSLFQS
jgi:ADP-ribosyl-[dinitrogen reductase] hydrolase